MPESSVQEHQIDVQQVFKSEADIPRDQDSVVLDTGHTADLVNFLGQNFDPSWKVKVEGRNVPFSKIPLERLVAESRADVLAATEILRVLHMELSQTDVLQKTKQANTLLDKEIMLNEVPRVLDAADYDLAKVENLMPIIDSFLAEIKDKLEEYKSDPRFSEILKLTQDGIAQLKKIIIDLRDAVAETRVRINPELALTFRWYYAGDLGKKDREYPEESWVHQNPLKEDLENFARIEANEMVDVIEGENGEKQTIPWSYDRKMTFILENLVNEKIKITILEDNHLDEIPNPEAIGLTDVYIHYFNEAIKELVGLLTYPFIIDNFEDYHGDRELITGRRGWRMAMGNLFGTQEFKDFYSQNKLKWNTFSSFMNALSVLDIIADSPTTLEPLFGDIRALIHEAMSVSESRLEDEDYPADAIIYSELPTLPLDGSNNYTLRNSKVGFMLHFENRILDLFAKLNSLSQQRAA